MTFQILVETEQNQNLNFFLMIDFLTSFSGHHICRNFPTHLECHNFNSGQQNASTTDVDSVFLWNLGSVNWNGSLFPLQIIGIGGLWNRNLSRKLWRHLYTFYQVHTLSIHSCYSKSLIFVPKMNFFSCIYFSTLTKTFLKRIIKSGIEYDDENC